jgi:hypothetical protein
MISFSAKIFKTGYNYAVKIPLNIQSEFVKSGYIPVRGMLNNELFKSTLIPRKENKYEMFLNAEIRKKNKHRRRRS